MVSFLLNFDISFKVTDSAVSRKLGIMPKLLSSTDLTMSHPSSYRIFSLGDTALTIDFGNVIDEDINEKVLALFNDLQQHPVDGMIEALPAYSSLSIYYDVFHTRKKVPADKSVFEYVADQLHMRLKQELPKTTSPGRLIEVPVCYDTEYGHDLENLASSNGLTIQEVIDIHCSTTYKVYMLGFLPGFGYMGQVDERISMNRKDQPQNVVAGSIGIAGRQTGIYPIDSPGGWHIIGRTPLKLFDAVSDPASSKSPGESCFCLLHPGDRVQFTSITKNEFENY